MSYIERDAFLAEQRHLYCENCARRKNGKGKFVYDIGDAPCRACGYGDVLDDVENAPAADVRPVVRGHWITEEEAEAKGNYLLQDACSVCGHCDWDNTESKYFNFCPNCGADMREES